ncbi:MAG: hypothetical protein M0Q21_12935 [Ignavibacteriaceae bacterium]|nr:hypothetical protein [Ignavibacteriaceae bacterium]
MKRFRLIAIFVLTATIIISAHEGKEHKKTISEAMPDTIIVVGKDTFAINGKAVNKSVLKQEPVVEKEPEFVLKPGEQIFAHLHNKMVHFPIALTLVAFLFSLLNIKRRDYDLVIKILLGLSFVVAIAAFFTGNIQLAPFIGDPKEWLANIHRLTGIISSILILLWGASLFIERIKKYSWVIGLIVVAAILITGFLGGVLAH